MTSTTFGLQVHKSFLFQAYSSQNSLFDIPVNMKPAIKSHAIIAWETHTTWENRNSSNYEAPQSFPKLPVTPHALLERSNIMTDLRPTVVSFINERELSVVRQTTHGPS